MTVYSYIENETDPSKLYEGIRSILGEMDRRGKYPEDWEVKKIQRLADARYEKLKGSATNAEVSRSGI